MFHKVKSVYAMQNFILRVHFVEGVYKSYDLKPLFDKLPIFKKLEKHPDLYAKVSVDIGGYGIVWNDELDLACDELWVNGVTLTSPFDGLLSFSDASKLWNLNESTLRKAITYGKLISGIDACKFGNQWIVTKEAMLREYGEPQNNTKSPNAHINANRPYALIDENSIKIAAEENLNSQYGKK